METYYTGLFVDDYRYFPPLPYKGKNWEIDLSAPLSSEHFNFLNYYDDGLELPTQEIIVYSKKRDYVLSFIDLCKACFPLVNGELVDTNLFPLTEYEIQNEIEKYRYWRNFFSTNYILLVCQIANKASYRKNNQYALLKYYQSLQAFTTNSYHLAPREWRKRKYWNTETYILPQRNDQVRAATAIILAYSAIEELGLEVRANKQKPSTIHGKWNPIVLNDLVNRLTKSKINLEENQLWVLRDEDTKIEEEKEPPVGSNLPWSDSEIRDQRVKITDAINYASYLRSRIASHKLKDIVESLNYYHVHNVQELARRLILEKLGFWRKFPEISYPYQSIRIE